MKNAFPILSYTLVGGFLTLFLCAPVSAAEPSDTQGMQRSAATTSKPSSSGTQPDPYTKPNMSWISISGTVKSVTPNTFVLDYGSGAITVEMDDGDRDADAYKLLSGDKVTVSGRIDDEFFEKTTIEASSVFVEKLGTYFSASEADEEDMIYDFSAPLAVSSTVLRGTVTSIGANEFVLDTGTRKVTVEIDELGYNPLDNDGYQKIETGDEVRVTGRVDADFFEGREFEATSVITLAG